MYEKKNEKEVGNQNRKSTEVALAHAIHPDDISEAVFEAEVWVHPEADKPYNEEIDSGEEATRQITSGLRPHQPLEEMKNTIFLDYPWNKLPGNALKAATLLGFNEANWPHHSIEEMKNTKFLDCPWHKLPENSRQAATALGYDETNWAKEWAPAEDKWWDDLNTSEREAALTLGWDQSAWDGKYNDKDFDALPAYVQKAVQSLGFTSQSWNDDEWPSSLHKWWNQFDDQQQKALNTIGYSIYDWE